MPFQGVLEGHDGVKLEVHCGATTYLSPSFRLEQDLAPSTTGVAKTSAGLIPPSFWISKNAKNRRKSSYRSASEQ